MSMLSTLVISIVLSGFGLGFFLLWRKITHEQQEIVLSSKAIQENVLKLERTLFDTSNQLHGHQKELTSHLLTQQSHSSKLFGEVQSSLGKVHELTSQFSHIGRELSSLQKLFDIPKRRGIFGEELLKKLLHDILPTERFSMQYRVGADSIVDAAILFTENRVLCIDAKFPMPSYQQYIETSDENRLALLKQLARDIKRHIGAIADRYIRQDLGTLPFALMYIPAESIYYDMFITQIDAELDQPVKGYAFDRKVYPVSPNTLFMFLHQICATFKHEVSERQVWQVMERVSALNNHVMKIQEHTEGVKRYLEYAQKRVGDIESSVSRFKKDLESIEMIRTQPELPQPPKEDRSLPPEEAQPNDEG